MKLILADAILGIHVLFVVFVVVGQICIMAGVWAKWPWVRNMKFRITHLVCIFIVVVQTWMGATCPLTIWENNLRRSAGEAGYEVTFINYWCGRLIYIEAPMWVFGIVYTLFGSLVAAYWFLAKPEIKKPR